MTEHLNQRGAIHILGPLFCIFLVTLVWLALARKTDDTEALKRELRAAEAHIDSLEQRVKALEKLPPP